MNAISRQRFEALAGYSRQPSRIRICECEWYEAQNERFLGLVILEGIDEEYGGIVFGRDADRRFRWIAGTEFFDTAAEAREALNVCIEEQSQQSDEGFEQDDETGTTSLLKPCVPEAQLGPLFRTLIESEGFSPARGLIDALSPYFRDLDGNFIQQFQTSAFDARIFELYLFATLHEMGYAFEQYESAPDYHCIDPWVELFVEAVTVQPTEGVEPLSVPDTEEGFVEYHEHAAIKFGSALWSKLQRKYWERPHVGGKPLVLAIQNFSGPLSTIATSTALATYLYGWRHSSSRDTDGHLIVTAERVGEHRYLDKVIPSDFFSLPSCEYISAVIHNPHATVAKFNRMGLLAGFGSKRIQLLRRGHAKDHDHDASVPTEFCVDVRDPGYSETWAEGLSVYHNPRAIMRLDRKVFPGSAHHYIRDDGIMESYTPEFFPMSSITMILIPDGSPRAEQGSLS